MPFDTLWIGTSWKMNKLRADARAFAEALTASDGGAPRRARNCSSSRRSRSVAEVAAMLERHPGQGRGAEHPLGRSRRLDGRDLGRRWRADAGATLAEIGHSERRTHFGETDETVALKVEAALRHGLTPLVCVGDTRARNTMPTAPPRCSSGRFAPRCRAFRPPRPNGW